MFWRLMLAGWTLLHAYVLLRAASLPALQGRRRWLAGFALASFLSLPVIQALDLESERLELVAMSWLATLFLIATCLLAVDLVTGFGLLARRAIARLRAGALAAGALLSVVALVQGARMPVASDHDVVLRGLPRALDGTALVVISDLHLGHALGAPWLERVVEQVDRLEPDAVLLAGDVFEGHGAEPGALVPVLARLHARLGVWGVLGNHDRRAAQWLERAGVTLLRDRAVALAPGLVLAGIDDVRGRRAPGEGREALERTLAERPSGATVLLVHRPDEAGRAAAAGVGLTLSGHTHGGQVWPFGLLIRTRTPWVSGRYQIDGMTLLVSRGTGTWGPRMRLWSRGEILRVTLRSPGAEAPARLVPAPAPLARLLTN